MKQKEKVADPAPSPIWQITI